jgi:hypothetical protein
VRADEGVEDEQARAQVLDGLGEAVAIFSEVEGQDGGGDATDELRAFLSEQRIRELRFGDGGGGGTTE